MSRLSSKKRHARARREADVAWRLRIREASDAEFAVSGTVWRGHRLMSGNGFLKRFFPAPTGDLVYRN